MSIFTDFVPAVLQVENGGTGASGAPKKDWQDVCKIDVSIYDNDAFQSTQSAKYEQSTHNGCTFCKDFVPGKEYRIVVGMYAYEVTMFNTSGRFTTLLLKRTLYAKQ